MRYFCTYFDSNYLKRGVALHHSLLEHGGQFELVVLCMDAAVEETLRRMALAHVRLLPLAELIRSSPPLANARANRSQLEFYFTCTPWLMRHLLSQTPKDELLTYLDADLFFFNSPESIYEEIGPASIGITPHRFPPTLAHLEQYGKFNVGWVSLRHNATGFNCAQDWAEKCAAWCYNRYELGKYADQKYLDAWPTQFGDVAIIHNPGANAAPWNIKDCTFQGSPHGTTINGQPLIFYHFHALSPIGQNLYNGNFSRYDTSVTLPLRELVYAPYLLQLHAGDPSPSDGQSPDLIPPRREGDPRAAQACAHVLNELRHSELDRAKRLLAMQSAAQTIAALETTGQRPGFEQTERALGSFGRHLRTLLVIKYRERLLPYLYLLAAKGTVVSIFECTKMWENPHQGNLRFSSGSFLDWLSSVNSLFNERAYLAAYPDVAAAVARGDFASGWEHFSLFGQYEGRLPTNDYCAGLAQFDAIAFDGLDTNYIIPCVAGRLQPHHRLIIGACESAEGVMPTDCPTNIIPGGVALIYRPPQTWIGPRIPSNARTLDGNWPKTRPQDIYPRISSTGAAWPKISIVTVSYNQGPFLEETLRSVLDQRYPNLEYIVVDGGSSDGSVGIIKKYADRLAFWVSEKDNGQSQALNKGFRRATGQILTWLNSDDRLAPGSLFTIAEAFLRHQPDLVVGRCARVTGQELVPSHLHRSSLPPGEIVPLPLDRLLDLDGCWLKGHFFHQPEVFFTRDIFDRSGGSLREDLYYSMDYDLWVRMAKAGALVLAVPEITAIFRQHNKQKTGGVDLPYLPELREVNAAHRGAGLIPAPQLLAR
jgi:GT2 family glycosyltransferase